MPLRTRRSPGGSAVLAALTALAMLLGACGSSTDEAGPPREPTPGEGDAGRAVDPAPDAGPSTTPDAAAPDAAGPITVSGRVVGPDGQVLASVGVSIPGKPIVYTALDGSFAIPDVTAPYDITISGANGGALNAHTFVGLSTASPRIVPLLEGAADPNPHHATLAGTLDSPVPTGQAARICIEGLAQAVIGCADLMAGQSAYSIDASWASGSSVPVRARAMRFALDSQNVIVDYTGAGSRGATLLEGAISTANIAFGAAPAKATLSAMVTYPTGSTNTAALAWVRLGPWLSFPLALYQPFANGKTFVIPVFPGASYSVLAGADISGYLTFGWEVGLAAGASAKPKLVLSPTLIAPADGATGVTNATKFEVDNPGGIPITLVCLPKASPNPGFVVSSSLSTITLPDLGAIGMPLPSGVQYGCSVLGAGNPGASPDTLVTGDGPIGSLALMSRLLNGGAGFAAGSSFVMPSGSDRTITTN